MSTTALTALTEQETKQQVDIRTSALNIIKNWNSIKCIQMDFNKAMEILQSRLDKDKSTEFDDIKWLICPLETLLHDDVCMAIIGFLTIDEKSRCMAKLNKFWYQKIDKLKFKEAFNGLLPDQIVEIIDMERFAIWLHHRYKWYELGYNERVWADIFKNENVMRLKEALSAFQCVGEDKIWQDMLIVFKCKYMVRGWFDDGEYEFIVHELGETILRGIRPQSEEYEEAKEYYSSDDDDDDDFLGVNLCINK